MLVEVCANSLQSAMNAEKAGADRIELCSELAVGGVTPSYGLLKAVSNKISIPVRVLIRPRSGDFTYSNEEFEIMKSDVLLCREMGFEGVVFGMLLADFAIDEKRMEEIAVLCDKMKTTFHRAFDWLANPLHCFQKLDDFGIDTLLSSGQQSYAEEGIDLLAELNQKASNITVMPGSGINIENAHTFKDKGFKAIHLSGVKMYRRLSESPKVGMSSYKMLSDESVPISHFETIQQIVKRVK